MILPVSLSYARFVAIANPDRIFTVPMPFLTNGFADLHDVDTECCQLIRNELATFQREFLATNPHDPGYPWPWWSRIWEYPYTLTNLLQCNAPDGPILDFGSGITAFPFLVAKRTGRGVICADIDGGFAAGIDRAARGLGLSAMRFVKTEPYEIPLDSGSVGCIYSVSVLEHIPEPSRIFGEFRRILSPGGQVVITMDVACRAEDEVGISAEKYRRLHELLREYFRPAHERRPVHPTDLLTTETSPFPLAVSMSPRARFYSRLKQCAAAYTRVRKPSIPWWRNRLLCEGFCGVKR